MGSSGSGGGDCNIGPIVWVRRRNGSWWPGKILGPDELSEGNLTSPRTGTPVKLLGREDASVDWYNLEKSKRVKPFRCGEFDDCIERAESANGMPIKKREKYARREDAILHALELEKQLLRKQENFSATSDQLRSKSSESTKEPSVCSDGLATNIGKSGNTNLNQRLNAVDSGINDEVVGSAINTKEENQSISEDDHCEATPRIKGLQDLGLKTAPLKRKFPWPVVSNGSDKPMLDNDIQANLVGGPGMERRNDANGDQHAASFYRAKRSRCNYLLSESNDSLDDQEILAKQNKMFPSELKGDDDHAHHHALSNEQNSSGFMEDIESDSSETVASDFESDSSLTEPHMDEEMTDFQDTALSSEAERDALSQRDAHGSTSTEEVDELTFPGSLQHFYPEEPFPGNETVSKWQLKGKRNIRTLSKRSSDGGDGKISTTSPQNYHGQYFNGVDLSRKYFGSQSVGPYASRFLSKGRNHYEWGEMMWDEPMENLNPIIFSNHHISGRPRPVLIDVDLQVQASYKRGVPIVSLTSKYNGKAIIGHPIQTEPLEDGSSETLVSINAIKAIENAGTSPVPPAWRTARRTHLRVPRAPLEDPLWVEQEDKFHGKKPNGGQKAGGGRKSGFMKKPPKRASLLGNQKTRTLSSIAGEHKFGVKAIQRIDGLVKPQTTTVACIPVKLVFSRLLEKINRAPSK